MTRKESLQLFEDQKVRTVWDDEQEKWYFAIVDVVGILTDKKLLESTEKQAYKRRKRNGYKL